MAYDILDLSDHNGACICGSGGQRVYCSRCGEDGEVFYLPRTGEHVHWECTTPSPDPESITGEFEEIILAALPTHAHCRRLYVEATDRTPDTHGTVHDAAISCIEGQYALLHGIGD